MVSVRVETAFKGPVPGQVVTLNHIENSYSPRFQDGDRWLFYVQSAGGSKEWSVSGCERSRPLADAADDLLFLRALPDSLKLSRLSGDVALYENSTSDGLRRRRPLAGLRVTVTGEQVMKEMFTNADGVYEIYGLPGSSYRVDVELPTTMKLYFSMVSGRRSLQKGEVRLPPGGGADVNFALVFDNHLTGRVLDPSGNPIKDVCVDLESTDSRRLRISGCAKGDRFVLEHVPPGEYLLVANRSGKRTSAAPFGAVYFPGTEDRKKASVVRVGEGAHLAGFDIRVPALSPLVRLTGRLQFSDGVAIARETVRFIANDGKYREWVRTAQDGTFQITVVSGSPGHVEGQIAFNQQTAKECPEFGFALPAQAAIGVLTSPSVAIFADSDRFGVVVTFPYASCGDWRRARLRE